MRVSLLPIAICLAVLACGDGENADTPKTPTIAKPFTDGRPVIEGTIVDSEDHPVAGVMVHLRLPYGAGKEGDDGLDYETGADGYFAFDVEGALEPRIDGPVEIQMKKDGYVLAHHRLDSHRPGRGLTLLALLQIAGGLTGTVMDPDGEPVADALVFAIRPDLPGVRRFVEVIHTRSASDGTFDLSGLPGGAKLDLGVKAEGYVAGLVTDLTIPRGKSLGVPDLVVRPGKKIAGRVVLSDGKGPVRKALVRVFRDPTLKDYVVFGRRGIRAAGGVVKVDKEGRFAVTGLADGPWEVDAVTLGLAPVRPGASAVPAGTDDVELVFVGASRVMIRVVDRETGKPFQRFRIVIQSITGPKAADGTPVLTEDADIRSPIGEFGFNAREGELYGLEIIVDGYDIDRRTIGPIKGGAPTHLSVPLKRRE